MKVVSDRILVQPLPEKEESNAFISNQPHSAPPQKGLIIEVGPGRGNGDKMVLAQGDTILYAKGAGTEIKIEGQKLIIMREGDAYCAL